ncbi:unnamed protein product, partial [Iphiclides podalirius]
MELQQRNDDNGSSRPTVANDTFQKIIGSFGKYQFWLVCLIIVAKFPVASHQMAIIFLAPKTSYVCQDTNAETCPCANPIYDTSIFNSTITTEWNLICERKWLTSFTQTLFQLGTLLGSIIFGMASDRFGRRLPLQISVLMQVVMGIAAAYTPDFWTFTFIRFFIGMSVGGVMVTTFVIIMEFVGPEHRDVLSALYQVPFNLGHVLLPVWSYYLRDFSDFQLGISVPTILLLVYFFLIPESPRWLIAVNETEKAIEILEKVAKVNKRSVDVRKEVETYQKKLMENNTKRGTVIDLFLTPNLRKNIICMAFNWLSCSYCFYGVSQYVGQLSGNVFVNVASSASVALIGSFLSIPLMKLMGRKTIVILFNFICALCLLLLCIVPEGVGSVVCACIGVVSSFIAFVVVYLYCSELFPTVVRNAALGFSSMMARVGSMIAPFVVEMGDIAGWLPPLGFAVVPLIATLVTFLLPETKGCTLTTTIDEGENFGKKSDDKISKPSDNVE